MENNYVVFDGKSLEFLINNVMISNGKFPSEFEIKGEYRISGESLAKIVAAFTDDIAVLQIDPAISVGLHRGVLCKSGSSRLFSRQAIDAKIIEENRNITKVNEEYFEKIRKLTSQIEQHNESNWICRIRKIKL